MAMLPGIRPSSGMFGTGRGVLQAAAEMNLLPLIFATLLFGAAASVLEPAKRDPLVAFFDGVNAAAGVIIEWVMKLAPYAVFILIIQQ